MFIEHARVGKVYVEERREKMTEERR